MAMFRLALVLLFCMTLPIRAETVVAGLSQTRISINTSFQGSEILVFGAVKREAPIPAEKLDVIITVQGPAVPVTVRRKARRLGIWVNTESVEVDRAPSFYSVSTTAPLSQALSQTEDLRHQVSIDRAIRAVGVADGAENVPAFIQALIRIRMRAGLYQMQPNTISLIEDTLFRTGVALPANLTEGDYVTRIFLTRGGQVIDMHQTTIPVRKVGLERWIFNLAHRQPLIYGLLSVLIAVIAGWGASAVFRYFRA